MPDPLDTSTAAELAYGLTRGVLKAWAQDGPAIITSTIQAWKLAWQTTMVDAQQAPPDLVANLNKEIEDATK